MEHKNKCRKVGGHNLISNRCGSQTNEACYASDCRQFRWRKTLESLMESTEEDFIANSERGLSNVGRMERRDQRAMT